MMNERARARMREQGEETLRRDEDDESSTTGEDTSLPPRTSTSRRKPSRLFDSLPASPNFWNAFILTCLLASIVLLLAGHTDATFVLATIGTVAWFINLRNSLRTDDVITGETSEREDVDEEDAIENE